MASITKILQRQRMVTGIVAGALTATIFVVVGTYWLGRGREEKASRPPQPLPQEVHQQLSGYTFTRSDEGRQIFSIHAARTVAFKQGGTTVLEDVYVEVFGRSGKRRDVIRTRRCDYSAQSGDLFSSGKVQIELDAPPPGEASGSRPERPPVMLETSQLYFRQQGSRVESDEPVRFRVGRLSGSARGMSYATREDSLELKSDVAAEFQPVAAGQLPLRLTASRARYDKEKGEVMLAGPVEFTQGSGRVTAESGRVTLDARNRVTRAVLEGGVRAADGTEKTQFEGSAHRLTGDFEPVSGGLRSLTAEGEVQGESRHDGSVARLAAQKLEVSFAGESPAAQQGTASGNVRITHESLAGRDPFPAQKAPDRAAAPEKKELTASALHFNFQPSGRSLKHAETAGPGRLLLVPADANAAGERVITAGQFLMDFDAQGRLATLRGVGGTKIVFQPAKNAPPGTLAQETSAERLVATLDPVSGMLRSVTQTGEFEFREGDRHATAERATYQESDESLALAGNPRVWDNEMRILAEKFLMDLRSDTAEGVGKVRSTHLGTTGESEPTNVLADRVVAQRRSQTVHYEGNVRAWRGSDVVQSASLDVFRNERRVSSGTRVLTSHLQPAALVPGESAQDAARPSGPVTIRADHLEYFDQGRKASYRGNVRLQTENTTLEANRLDAYFSNLPTAHEMELERAVADGSVKVTQPGRRATGTHAEYFAAEGKIAMSGGPPALYDAEKGTTTGQRLTFYIHDDRLLVDGGDKSPTISRHRIVQ
ncbi:MAG: LPS export ABC transporter periplasmic protein LptC [Acidobacteriia bacterium]|nr:LPS export ABC transporter periplasmic protein LptC [Terriglobia bacterium]